MKKRYYLLSAIVILVILYLAGPKPDVSGLDDLVSTIELSGAELEDWLNDREKQVTGIKLDNEARIIWTNPLEKQKTEYVLVYLHGFSASQGEGDPIHVEFAKRYGMNLFLARLQDHGVSRNDIFKNLTVGNYMASAREALEIGKQLGQKVIIMSTSTGGTMSLYMAPEDPSIHSLILYSPNIRINNSMAPLMGGPWGLQLTRRFAGGDYFDFPRENYGDSLYWTGAYRIEGMVALQALMNKTMKKKTYNTVTQPVFMGYYFKNEEEQDRVVSVDAMLEMYDALGTSESQKRKVPFADVGRHVIASKYKSKAWESVREETYLFAEEILGLKPISN